MFNVECTPLKMIWTFWYKEAATVNVETGPFAVGSREKYIRRRLLIVQPEERALFYKVAKLQLHVLYVTLTMQMAPQWGKSPIYVITPGWRCLTTFQRRPVDPANDRLLDNLGM